MKAIVELLGLSATLPNNGYRPPSSTFRVFRSVIATLLQCLLLHFAPQSYTYIHTYIYAYKKIIKKYELLIKIVLRKNKMSKKIIIKGSSPSLSRGSNGVREITFFYFLFHVILTCFLYVPHWRASSQISAFLRRKGNFVAEKNSRS